jgi:hypothetical protein
VIVRGSAWLDDLALPQPYRGKVASLRSLIEAYTAEIGLLEEVINAGRVPYLGADNRPRRGQVGSEPAGGDVLRHTV